MDSLHRRGGDSYLAGHLDVKVIRHQRFVVQWPSPADVEPDWQLIVGQTGDSRSKRAAPPVLLLGFNAVEEFCRSCKGWLESRFLALRVQPSHGFVHGGSAAQRNLAACGSGLRDIVKGERDPRELGPNVFNHCHNGRKSKRYYQPRFR